MTGSPSAGLPKREPFSSDGQVDKPIELVLSTSIRDFFLRLLSVTTHSTWSRRQFVQGEPLSTTSQRTLRARQQQHALEALLFTGRLLEERPAVEALRLLCRSDSVDGELTTAIVAVVRKKLG